MNIRTRIAPSPTGPFHIGTARTALFNYLFAKKNRGEFILRIEDTDIERSDKKYEDDIKNSLSWLGLNWDDSYRQSSRNRLYHKYAQELLDGNMAYKKKGDKGRGEAVLLRDQKKAVRFNDLIRGPISFGAESLGEIVLLKSDGTPTYNFAAAIDDVDMNITHVIRGEDHISNTPKQVIIQEALGLKRPLYAHIPLILGPDRSKLSKRHGAEQIAEYRREGYLAPAMINFMVFLGWNPGGEQELFSIEELKKVFELSDIQKGGAIFNQDKLDWFNHQYIKQTKAKEFKKIMFEYLNNFEPKIDQSVISDTFLSIVKPRLKRLSDIKDDLVWFKISRYQVSLLNWKKTSQEATQKNLRALFDALGKIGDKDFKVEKLEKKLMPLANKRGKGETLWPLRVAMSGIERSPSPFELMALVGKKETMSRVKKALEKLT